MKYVLLNLIKIKANRLLEHQQLTWINIKGFSNSVNGYNRQAIDRCTLNMANSGIT
jgi:uncharacterized lipoprotein YehR (DUF1307 family)